MDRKKIELIVTGILIIVFIIVLANSLKPRRPKKVVKPRVEVKVEKPPPLPVKIEEYNIATSSQLTAQKKRAELDWGIDPFYHPIKKDVASSLRLVLKGISIGKGRKNYAFINDEIVAEGEKVSGYEVVRVEKNRVLLRRGKEEFYLILPEEDEK